MTPEKQRVAIAEACGWKFHMWEKDGDYMNCCLCGLTTLSRPLPKACNKGWAEEPPDYPSDLNAAIELVNVLAEEGWNCACENGLDKTWEITLRHNAGDIFVNKTIVKGTIYAPADTLPAAICRGFLEVRGFWRDE